MIRQSTAVAGFTNIKKFIEFKEDEFRRNLIKDGLDPLLIPDVSNCYYVYKLNDLVEISRNLEIKLRGRMAKGENIEDLNILEVFDKKADIFIYSEYKDKL